MDITKKNKKYKKNNYNKNGISIVIIIIIAYVTAISSVIEIGGFIVTQAQEGEQSPFGPVFPLPTSPSPSPTSPSPTSRIVSPEIKAQMCDPNNPKLEFVNSTESEVCGLPKSIRNDTTTSPITPPSSPKPITPPSSPKPITPPSSPRSITPSRPPTPEEIPELP
jgi:hypothetical protein